MLHATFPNFPTTPVLQLLFVAFEHHPLKPPSFTQPKQTFSMQFHQVFMISSLECTVGDVPDSHKITTFQPTELILDQVRFR